MEIATTLLQPMVTALPQTPPSAGAAVPDGLFAMFFAQKLNIAAPVVPAVDMGTAAPWVKTEEGGDSDATATAEGQQPQAGQTVSAVLQTAVPAEAQVMAMMQMAQQSLVGRVHLSPVAPEASANVAEISSVTPAGAAPVTDLTGVSTQTPVTNPGRQSTEAPTVVSPGPVPVEQHMPAVASAQPELPAPSLDSKTRVPSAPAIQKTEVSEQKAPESRQTTEPTVQRNMEPTRIVTNMEPQPSAFEQAPQPVTAPIATEPRQTGQPPVVVAEQQKAVPQPQENKPDVDATPHTQKAAAVSDVKPLTPAAGYAVPHVKGVTPKAEVHQQQNAAEMVETGATQQSALTEVSLSEVKQGASTASGQQQEQQLPGEKLKEQVSPTHMSGDFLKAAEPNRDQAAAQPVAEQRPAPEHEHIVAQVKEKLASHEITPGKGQISFSLHPQELGELKITMRMEDNRLKVDIVAQNHTVREALVQNIDGLRESLSRQSITVDRFDVSTGGGSFNETFREGKQAAQNRPGNWYPQYGATREEQEQKTAALWQPREDSLVDVRF